VLWGAGRVWLLAVAGRQGGIGGCRRAAPRARRGWPGWLLTCWQGLLLLRPARPPANSAFAKPTVLELGRSRWVRRVAPEMAGDVEISVAQALAAAGGAVLEFF
jgi:hypothetical protein